MGNLDLVPHHEKQPKHLIEFARENRNNLSLPERLLWRRLKEPANKELPINRQYPVLGKYILDYFYEDLQLAIVIDSKAWHDGRSEQDSARQQAIEVTGIAFLRLPARFILRDPDAAAELVLSVCRGELALEDLDPSLL
ncbi:MAG: DUF559 domain-containing protein [Armatimonadota bacterium]